MRLKYHFATLIAFITVSLCACANAPYEEIPHYSYDISLSNDNSKQFVEILNNFAKPKRLHTEISSINKEEYVMYLISMQRDSYYITALNPSRLRDFRVIAYLRVGYSQRDIGVLDRDMKELMSEVQNMPSAPLIANNSQATSRNHIE